ncbi:MAG TPA: FAD-dependent oxidoreductase, partial [Desulfosalsimonadaceae bacterium]|nr:FAD-dependent oxidoreductase [Desulfosalsimonadaceae bacterium]
MSRRRFWFSKKTNSPTSLASAHEGGITMATNSGSVLVIGGGISGMRSAMDLAEAGCKVYLVDKAPHIGG